MSHAALSNLAGPMTLATAWTKLLISAQVRPYLHRLVSMHRDAFYVALRFLVSGHAQQSIVRP